MAKALSEIIGKLKVDEIKSLLTELDVTFDETFLKPQLVDLLTESIPADKTLNEEGELVEKSPENKNDGEDGEGSQDKPPSRSEVRRRKEIEMLPEGKVRLTDNVKFKGTYYKKGDVLDVTQEEEEMLNVNGLIEF